MLAPTDMAEFDSYMTLLAIKKKTESEVATQFFQTGKILLKTENVVRRPACR